jgi:hypothetical protein
MGMGQEIGSGYHASYLQACLRWQHWAELIGELDDLVIGDVGEKWGVKEDEGSKGVVIEHEGVGGECAIAKDVITSEDVVVGRLWEMLIRELFNVDVGKARCTLLQDFPDLCKLMAELHVLLCNLHSLHHPNVPVKQARARRQHC